ncbi:leukocyte elastase inhibitor-like isoform X3 [Zophobas morio]|uniref:leukocyte elastase inhibitor-like isoform X3 n=1 Tax=Zophobas morio TaxID=2755281 RepID=UPI0030833205
MGEKTAEVEVLDSNSEFTINLYNVLAATSPGNSIFSPISLHAVLSMAYQGARGTTAEKFASTLKVPEAKVIKEGYKILIDHLNTIPYVTLLMANKVYLMEGYQLLPDFNNAVTENFVSEVQLLNFRERQSAAESINIWVEEKTQEKIKNLVNAGDLDGSTRLVLVNAIYFKARWMHVFSKNATRTEPFYLNDVDSVNVEMMHMKRKFHFNSIKEMGAKILELPYTNKNLSMVIILPFERNGIAELEKKLTTVNLAEITNELWNAQVTVALPKFKIEQTIDLKDSLTELGLGEIFSPVANFSGMITSKEPLYVSKVIQKAFIEVNEEGAEAAAATGMTICPKKLIKGPHITFIADHPFIIMLLEKINGKLNILFTGKIRNPQI